MYFRLIFSCNNDVTKYCSNQCPDISLFHFTFQFEQFSRTVGNAAVDQQQEMRDALFAFANFFSQSAYDVGAKWPIYSLPNYELHANSVLKQSGMEILSVTQYVKDSDKSTALKYVDENYERWVYEGHMTRYGNLDRLTPIKYQPNFTIVTAEGFIPDPVQRDIHYGLWQFTPRKFGLPCFASTIFSRSINIIFLPCINSAARLWCRQLGYS